MDNNFLLNVTDLQYTALIQQAYYSGIVDVICYIILLIFTGITVLITTHLHKKVSEYKDNSLVMIYFIPLWLSLIAIACWCLMLIQLPITISAFTNPEYWAIQDIINKSK
jgi:hypothetical protein